ncbi:hypothetical protein [Escherichia coli]|uniref:hypothetical protein n=1 Tax=Escherichia coli TaxID=562 RepID=UPI00339D0EE4
MTATRKLAERLRSAAGALLALRNKRALLDALAEAMSAENHRIQYKQRALVRWGMPAASGRRCSPAAMAHDAGHATRHTADGNGRRQFASSARRVFGRDAVITPMTISYFTVGAVVKNPQATAMPASAAAPIRNSSLSPLLRAAINAFDEAVQDAALSDSR